MLHLSLHHLGDAVRSPRLPGAHPNHLDSAAKGRQGVSELVRQHGEELVLSLIGRLELPLEPAPLGDLVKHQDDTLHLVVLVADRGCGVVDGAFGTVPADQDGVVRQGHGDAVPEDLVDGTVGGFAGVLVHDDEDV